MQRGLASTTAPRRGGARAGVALRLLYEVLLSGDVKPVLRLRAGGLQGDRGLVRCVLSLLALLLSLLRLRRRLRLLGVLCGDGQRWRGRELLQVKLAGGHTFLMLLVLMLLLVLLHRLLFLLLGHLHRILLCRELPGGTVHTRCVGVRVVHKLLVRE